MWKQTITRPSSVAIWLHELESEYHVHGETLAITTVPQSMVLAVVRVSERKSPFLFVDYAEETIASYDGVGGA